jgi:hypothetical protein
MFPLQGQGSFGIFSRFDYCHTEQLLAANCGRGLFSLTVKSPLALSHSAHF